MARAVGEEDTEPVIAALQRLQARLDAPGAEAAA
jgi:hypothetical protein